ncbi:Junctional adhesion molecule C [Bagarius yarrelli]|uniref:Junctional adhesion molecule C n=1 Tax=Bagarius yarrelli TaxID=175774 RepID=A0A556V726_BAGYA|nr:Junctional adhesion molecule C [Bagarius yarrelli]
MATGRQTFVTVLFYSLCCLTSAVILKTSDKDVWVNEFECDLKNRALLREPANLLILNASRSDSALYRCEVVAIDDQKTFDEIAISLTVRVKPVVPQCSVPDLVTAGSSTELNCKESQGYPQSQYQWFRNNEELPEDPKTSIHFYNSSYVINAKTGSLKFRLVRKEDAGEYHCQAKNDAGYAKCEEQLMQVYDFNVGMLLLKIAAGVIAFVLLTVVLCIAHKRGYCSCGEHTETDYKVPQYDIGMDYATADEDILKETNVANEAEETQLNGVPQT